MQIFIFLSHCWAFISNAIYEGERSLNRTSTPSRLRFVHPPPIPLPPPLPSPLASSSTTRYNPAVSLSLSWGMWAQIKMPQHTQKHTSRNRPSPSRAGSSLLDGRIGDRETQGGTQEVGGPYSASQNMSHDVCRGSFSLSILLSSSTDASNTTTRTK